MAITLVVNPGSSSKKYALYKESTLLLNAYIEKSENGFELCTVVKGIAQRCESLSKHDYHTSLRNFIELAIREKLILSLTDIKRVSVRVVAPGTYFQTHQVIDESFMKKLGQCVSLSPLHVPHTEKEIISLKQTIPHAKFIAVSDSAFHSTKPDVANKYSLPTEELEKLDLYRFGYHGISVSSVLNRYHSVLGVDPKRVIVCHIGNGVSVTATKNGKSVDTTMGYAPGSGLIMGSRAGDLDAGALLTLMQAKNLKPTDAQVYLQTNGGLKGISGESDLRYVLDRSAQGKKDAILALNSFVYQIQKVIGSYLAVLNGADTLVFSATAGERSSTLRKLICEGLDGIGIKLDEDKNEACVSRDGVISALSSNIKVAVIKTDESKEILQTSLVVE